MNIEINMERLDDNRLKVSAQTLADEWGAQRGSWRIASAAAKPTSEAATIGLVIEALYSVPPVKSKPTFELGPPVEANVPDAVPADQIGKGSLYENTKLAFTVSTFTNTFDIERVLTDAVRKSRLVDIEYERLDGQNSGLREQLLPVWIGETRDGHPSTMTVNVIENNLQKSFRLSGIKRVVVR